MRIAILALFALTLHAADERKPTNPPKIELPEAVRPLVELAHAAPPEFFAATVVDLVRSGRIPQREAQIEMLEEAFNAASGAKEPIRLIAIPSTPVDSRAIYRGKAGDLNLDALSLQSRVLEELLTVDRAKARELFDHIARPELDPRPCADPLIADASAYYGIAAAIAQSAFSPEEKKQEAHVQFLNAVLAGAHSPNELAPFARALQSVELKPDEWELLLEALAAKLENIGTDYRPFAMSADSLEAELSTVMDLAQADGLSVDPLREGFRRYLIAQLNAPRCRPSIPISPGWVQKFVEPGQIKPPNETDSFSVETYFESGDAKAIGESLARLRGLSEADRRQQLADFLTQFAVWQPEGSAIDVFHQKATVLRALLQMTSGEDHDRVLNLCLSLLESGAERDAPAEWLWEVKNIASGIDAAKMLPQFLASSDVGLKLYAEMGGNF